VGGKGGGEPHPQGDGGDGPEDLDDPLDDRVRQAAEVPGDAPRKTPRNRLRVTLTRPMVMEVRVPDISRDQRSRPWTSVPRMKRDSSGRASSTARRWRLQRMTPKSL